MIELEVLNTGAGHLRLTFNPGEPDEVAKARETIQLLLRRGFALFIQDGGRTKRVRDFDPERGSYYVDEVPAPSAEAPTTCECGKPLHHRGRCLSRTKELPAASTKAIAVGRTAGG